MILRRRVRRIINRIGSVVYRLRHRRKERFECPICGYRGPFRDVAPLSGVRKHAQCPACNALERHRIQFLVVEELLNGRDLSGLRMLHFAPEPFFREYFSKRLGHYETADLNRKDVDHKVDLQKLPIDDESYDIVYASHVLEHIPDDEKAISEIRRILKPGGIAVLPVPLVSDKTVEYPAPNPYEADHVRAPGFDYFNRYERYFSRVVTFSSEAMPGKYQLFVYEDRSGWPNRECPLRPPMQGEKHSDIVPVCYV